MNDRRSKKDREQLIECLLKADKKDMGQAACTVLWYLIHRYAYLTPLYETLKTISAGTHTSESTTKRAINELCSLGYVVKTQRRRKNVLLNDTNLLLVNPDKVFAMTKPKKLEYRTATPEATRLATSHAERIGLAHKGVKHRFIQTQAVMDLIDLAGSVEAAHTLIDFALLHPEYSNGAKRLERLRDKYNDVAEDFRVRLMLGLYGLLTATVAAVPTQEPLSMAA